MKREEFTAMLNSISESWQKRDYARAAAFYAKDIHYADPLNYRFDNRADLQKFFENDEGFEQKNTWHNIIFDESQQIGAVEYTYEGTHRYHGIALVKVANDKITHWREYQHISQLDWKEFCSGTEF
jgi:hypothetical protein